MGRNWRPGDRISAALCTVQQRKENRDEIYHKQMQDELWFQINGLAQDCGNSSTNALELLQTCAQPTKSLCGIAVTGVQRAVEKLDCVNTTALTQFNIVSRSSSFPRFGMCKGNALNLPDTCCLLHVEEPVAWVSHVSIGNELFILLVHMINNIIADALAPWITRSSAGMALT